MKTIVIIPAAGVGKRCNTNLPKQYVKFCGKEMLAYTIEKFQNCKAIDEIIIAVNMEYYNDVISIVNKYNLNKVIKVVMGGKERQDSVYNAIKLVDATDDDIVLVHDAARPFVTTHIIESAIDFTLKKGATVVAIAAKDTLLKSHSNTAETYLDRKFVYYVQTPQSFKYSILKNAFEYAYANNKYYTDESSLVKEAGFPVEIIEGSFINFKVTTSDDLLLAEKLLQNF